LYRNGKERCFGFRTDPQFYFSNGTYLDGKIAANEYSKKKRRFD
jgi:hypothetical protein